MAESKGKPAEHAIDWDANAVPVSQRFDDPYFSRQDGFAETGHVFIGGNDLPARWPSMAQCLIGELGFGTGLNFLATAAAWRSLAPRGAQLHFISFEQFPLERNAMAKALARWPQLAEGARRLAGHWDPAYEFLDCAFDERIRLTVFFSDANSRLPQCDFAADAWYLDGFSPAKNPELWSGPLMQAVFDCTRPGGSFATYTAAGWVKRNLEDAGFSVEKRPGFGTKRDMLAGVRPVD